jgi:flavin reductase (DIM6/NTAB) family NADH-FMN oxidoreductase RutF
MLSRADKCDFIGKQPAGMQKERKAQLVELDTAHPIWRHFFTVAPLVLIGTREGAEYNLAPKHMATPLGQGNYFGFVCTPRHSTYRNIEKTKEFAVSFPRPDQVVLTSLAATARQEECSLPKPVLGGLPTRRAECVDALFLEDAYLWLECELDRIVDGFADYSLIAGKIVRAVVDESALRSSERDEQRLVYEDPLLAFLAFGRFAAIRESYAFPYPREFKD